MSNDTKIGMFWGVIIVMFIGAVIA